MREWSGNFKAKPVTEFLTQIALCVRVSNWDDVVNILKAKLTGEAIKFVNGRDHVIEESGTYKILKSALLELSSEKLPARYHYNLLHEATQEKRSPIQLLDRCRSLSAKTIRRSATAMEQRVLREEAYFRH
jgi:hypothetical protein